MVTYLHVDEPMERVTVSEKNEGLLFIKQTLLARLAALHDSKKVIKWAGQSKADLDGRADECESLLRDVQLYLGEITE